MTNLARGKVARILNSREVAINVGSDHGVCIGMYFDILDQNLEDILDPDSRQRLGSIERPKVRVRITMVQEKLSLASTYKKKKVNVGGSANTFADLSDISRALMPAKWITMYETLKTEEKTWETLEEKKSFVKTGDPVVQVVETDVERVSTDDKTLLLSTN